MPLGNDPTPLAELEAGFGVTANAEELVKQNAARFSSEQLSAGLKPPNEEYGRHLDDNFDALEKHVGQEVVNAEVRGSGGGAVIQYVTVGPRDEHVKGYVPFVELFGDKAAKDRRASRVASRTTPDEAAMRAADSRLQEADRDAQAELEKAQEKAREAIEKAREEAEKVIQDAQAEADRIREKASEDAQKAADKAREDAEKARAQQSSQQRRSGGGQSKS
jgi:molecular chaperone DnaK (HSP70)